LFSFSSSRWLASWMDVSVCTHGPWNLCMSVCLKRANKKEGTKIKDVTVRQRSRYEYRFVSHFVGALIVQTHKAQSLHSSQRDI
jgi:hypothetical protein